MIPRFAGHARVIPARDTLLLPYQARWVRDKSRLKIAEKSRQIGWTWATAYGIVSRLSRQAAKQEAWISSRDDLQARLFLEDCKGFAGLLNLGATDLGEKVIDDDGHSAYVLQFDNSLRAHSMSSNPDAQAGKRGDRVLDEFALHPDPRKLYSIAYPGITWGGQLEMFSTHRGTANFFNGLITEIRHKGNPKGFSLHRVTLQDALEDGFLYKLQTKLPEDDQRQAMDEAQYFDFVRAGCADDESFQQEFCCNPADDASAFLSYDLIASCQYQPGEEWEMSLDELGRAGDLFVGVDIGREHDFTVIWVFERQGDVLLTRKVVCLEKRTFAEQEEVLYEILALPNVRRCCIDRTGIGRQFAERAREKFGNHRVEEVNFTSDTKEKLAEPVKAAFEDRSVRIPDDKFVRADLRNIRKTTTASGNPRYDGERTKAGHSDRFWALALAREAAGLKQGKVWVTVC